MAEAGRWSFGPFEFEPGTGRLTKHGHRIKLQPKSAAILSCLLDRRGEVVSRTQLQKELWPEGIYVNFELGIKVALKKLRDALGDLTDDPVYIQTVYGEGYRFIAPVVPVALAPSEAPEISREAIAVPLQPSKAPGASRRKLLWVSSLAATAAVVILAVILSGFGRTAPLYFQSRDWVVIAAFENLTGEKLLDGSLDYALERELSESRYLNVAPRERVGDALKLMRQSPTAVLNLDLARQVAIRDGEVRAVLAGRVERLGRKYVLTIRIVNPASGQTVGVFKRESNQEQLPDRMRSISDEIRRRLGERSPETGVAQAARLEKATTTSLAALGVFSLGMRTVNEFKWGAAAALFEEATREDAQFALAHIYAAHCYLNIGQQDKAAPHFEAAFRLAPEIADRERLFILGSYYGKVLHDDRHALATYEALTNLYRDDYWGLNNLMGTYQRLGMFRESLKTGRRLLAVRPNEANTATRGLLVSRIALETATDRWNGGDLRGAAAEVARVSSHTMAKADDYSAVFVAMANINLGRNTAAKGLCGHVTDPVTRCECLFRVAWAASDRQLAMEQLSQLRSSGPIDEMIPADVPIALWLGEMATARQWAQRRPSRNLEGEILLAEGHLKEATEKLQTAQWPQAYSEVHYTTHWRRLAMAGGLEGQGKIREAIAALESDTRPSIASLTNGWAWTPCRVKLADLYRKAGRVDDAVKVEDEIRLYLSEADPDHPLAASLRRIRVAASK